jgi:polysaccharide export outer membrane protein
MSAVRRFRGARGIIPAPARGPSFRETLEMSVRTGIVASFVVLLVTIRPCSAQTSGPFDRLELRTGDAVRLAVKMEPEWSGEYPVGPAGNVMLPLIGSIGVAGRPFAEVVAEVERSYARELADPELEVSPLLRVSVLGEVKLPGLYLVDPTQRLREVLAMAGGILPSASRKRMVIVREGEQVEVEYDAGSTSLDVMLRSGDQLFVERRSWLTDNLPIFIGAVTSVAAAAVTSLIVR